MLKTGDEIDGSMFHHQRPAVAVTAAVTVVLVLVIVAAVAAAVSTVFATQVTTNRLKLGGISTTMDTLDGMFEGWLVSPNFLRRQSDINFADMYRKCGCLWYKNEH